jgi:DNA invertase Pin-like site-specific DNA recombinase
MSAFDVMEVSSDGTYTTKTVEVERTTSHNRSMRPKVEPEFQVLREVGYMRVSADAQDVDLQKRALLDAGCEVIFSDKWTGKDKHRPGLDAMVEQLREGDRVNVWKVDRMGRSTVNGILFVAELKQRKVAFRSLTQDFDTSSALGRMVLGVLLVFAEFERETIVERVQAGVDAAKARGIVGGTRRALDGAQVTAARLAYAERPIDPSTGRPMSINQLAKVFGVDRTTFLRWANPNYFEGNSKDAQRFRERHPDLENWLKVSDNPHFADSPKRRSRVG